MKKIHQIVITGGPCGGKSSALPYLKSSLEEKGFEVIIMPEAATLVIQSGILYGGNISKYNFQKIVLEMILATEKTVATFAENYIGGKEIVCLYDRGISDISVYLESDTEFKKLLGESGLDFYEIYSRYSGVVHMVSSAIGAEHAYTKANNSARRETAAEAAELDRKTLSALLGYPKLHIVTNHSDFETKKRDTLSAVLSIIADEEIERGFITKTPKNEILKRFSQNGVPVFLTEIQQTHVRDSKGSILRLREEKSGSHTCFTQTSKYKLDKGSMKEVESKISEGIYKLKMSNDSNFGQLQKSRYYFVFEDKYFSIDFYEDESIGFSRLEIEFASVEDSKKFFLPKKLLEIIPDLEEVTGKSEYSNYSIACR